MYKNIGVIKNEANYNNEDLENFLAELEIIKLSKVWKKNSVVQLFNSIIKDFNHKETGKYLDGRM